MVCTSAPRSQLGFGARLRASPGHRRLDLKPLIYENAPSLWGKFQYILKSFQRG